MQTIYVSNKGEDKTTVDAHRLRYELDEGAYTPTPAKATE